MCITFVFMIMCVVPPGGFYHGKIKFPAQYPYKPPSIYMITPSGRFKPNVRLCLSMSDFHPEEWSCLWSVASILSGLLSFMVCSTALYHSICDLSIYAMLIINIWRTCVGGECTNSRQCWNHYQSQTRTGATITTNQCKEPNLREAVSSLCWAAQD